MLECNYSFEDLYKAAFGRKISEKKKKEFQTLTQKEINDLVNRWAQKAQWKTNKRKGADGEIYISFHQ